MGCDDVRLFRSVVVVVGGHPSLPLNSLVSAREVTVRTNEVTYRFLGHQIATFLLYFGAPTGVGYKEPGSGQATPLQWWLAWISEPKARKSCSSNRLFTVKVDKASTIMDYIELLFVSQIESNNK